MITNSPYKWPAEWEPQSATWIAWPHNLQTWPDNFDPIPQLFRKFVVELAAAQPVHILGGNASAFANAQQLLSNISRVTVHDIETNDCWIRDYGPTFVIRKDDKSMAGIVWKYNAWGGKYPPWEKDAAVGEAICRQLRYPHSVSPLYCEGGALDTDGLGTLLTSSSCLLNPNRNPGWTRELVEQELRCQLGVEKFVWVDGGGLAGDDTDGHIDQLARFVSPGVVVAATASDVDDPNFSGLEENLRILRGSTDAEGRVLTVHSLPTPLPRFIEGKRVPESYCNFVLANGIVIVPTFRSQRTDEFALDLFRQLFPERSIVPLDAADLAWGLGAFHCASQQQPALE